MKDRKEYKNEYYRKNREKYLRRQKEKYFENHKEILEQRKIERANRSPEKKAAANAYAKKYREENSEKVKAYFQSDTHKYKQYYKQSASRRGKEFELTYEDFLSIFHQSCTYCGEADARGIDRVDNTLGYLKENCAPCCDRCNKMKWSFSKEDFLSHAIKIANYQRS